MNVEAIGEDLAHLDVKVRQANGAMATAEDRAAVRPDRADNASAPPLVNKVEGATVWTAAVLRRGDRRKGASRRCRCLRLISV